MKKFLRILKWIAIALAAVILFIPISIAADAALGAERINGLANLTIPGANGAPDVYAYVAAPKGEGPFPAVIMIHEFFGLNEDTISRAELLAESGYLVIAPDTFRGETTSWIPRAVYLVTQAEQAQINTDLDSVFAWLEAQPNVNPKQIGIAGFCYGGRVSLLYSLSNPNIAATVVFYGSSETNPEVLKNLPAPVLGIFGGADVSIPLEEVDALNKGLQAAGVLHQISVYDGQPHAFVVNADGVRAGGAQAQAWKEMLDFLERNLKGAPSSRNGMPLEYSLPFDWGYYLFLAYEHAFGTASHLH